MSVNITRLLSTYPDSMRVDISPVGSYPCLPSVWLKRIETRVIVVLPPTWPSMIAFGITLQPVHWQVDLSFAVGFWRSWAAIPQNNLCRSSGNYCTWVLSVKGNPSWPPHLKNAEYLQEKFYPLQLKRRHKISTHTNSLNSSFLLTFFNMSNLLAFVTLAVVAHQAAAVAVYGQCMLQTSAPCCLSKANAIYIRWWPGLDWRREYPF